MQAKSPLAVPAKLLPELTPAVQLAPVCMHPAAPASSLPSSASSEGFASLLAGLLLNKDPAAAGSPPPAATDPSSPVPDAASGMSPTMLGLNQKITS